MGFEGWVGVCIDLALLFLLLSFSLVRKLNAIWNPRQHLEKEVIMLIWSQK